MSYNLGQNSIRHMRHSKLREIMRHDLDIFWFTIRDWDPFHLRYGILHWVGLNLWRSPGLGKVDLHTHGQIANTLCYQITSKSEVLNRYFEKEISFSFFFFLSIKIFRENNWLYFCNFMTFQLFFETGALWISWMQAGSAARDIGKWGSN